MQFIIDNILWVSVAFVSGAMLLWPLVRQRSIGPGVSPLQAILMINREDAIVLDVREGAEWSRGHIPNARHIPLSDLPKRIGEIEKYRDRPIIVNCQSGNRSASACGALRKAGFTKVFNLAGGLPAWEQAGQPVTTK